MVGTRLRKTGHTCAFTSPGLGAFPQERQKLWLPKDDLRDSSSWASPPLVLLRDIHSKFLTHYDCKEVCAQSQSQVNVGSGAGPSSQSQVNIGAGPRTSSQDGVSQLQEPVPLSLPLGSPNRYSATGSPSRISNSCLWARTGLNS
jgi:hypothetical protein